MAKPSFFNNFQRIFGFNFTKNTDVKAPSPVPPNPNDGSVIVGAPNQFGYYGLPRNKIDINLTEQQLITRYRDMSLHHLVDWAINEVTDEVLVQDDDADDDAIPAVRLDLSTCTQIPDEAKEVIMEEFKNVLDILSWNLEAYTIFRNFYTDGRLYYQIIPFANTELGIKELRYIDPRQIRKFIEIKEEKDPISQINYTKIIDEYYIYSPFGVDYNGTSVVPTGERPIINGTILTKDSVAFIHSGIFDPTSSVILSPLHKAIRPLSQLKSMENATLIYKIARSPERRIWKVPVGTMPEKQVPHYLDQLTAQYRTKSSYDAISGDVIDERKVLSIIDDIFIPVPSSGEHVEVDTIPGGSGFDDTSTLDFFNKQLLRSLNVPASRLQDDAIAMFGNTGAISRDERQFAKLVSRLRRQFSTLFISLLGTQLRLKKIVTDEKDFEYLLSNWKFVYATDNYYSEMSDSAIMSQRIALAAEAKPLVGSYLSNRWIKRSILKQTDAEQAKIQSEIKQEIESGEITEQPVIDPVTGQMIDPTTGQPVSMPQSNGPFDPTQQTQPGDFAPNEAEQDEVPNSNVVNPEPSTFDDDEE